MKTKVCPTSKNEKKKTKKHRTNINSLTTHDNFSIQVFPRTCGTRNGKKSNLRSREFESDSLPLSSLWQLGILSLLCASIRQTYVLFLTQMSLKISPSFPFPRPYLKVALPRIQARGTAFKRF